MPGKPFRWVRRNQLPGFAGAIGGLGAAAVELTEVPVHDPPLAPRDEVVFLLHAAAEVEHALLVQYLYAAYSLDPAVPGATTSVDPEGTSWRDLLISTAKEEMGHLVTVENILRAVGGPVNLDREDFPFRSDLYPFRFTLERLTPGSVAKYVAAEAPDRNTVPAAEQPELDAILEEARKADPAGHGGNRVGALYLRLINLVERLDLDDFRFDPGTISGQGTPEFWRGENDGPLNPANPTGIMVGVVRSPAEAVAALRAIARQGEGLAEDTAADPNSHFYRFREIYRGVTKLPDPWRASRPVATNPTTAGGPPTSAGDRDGDGPIENPHARGWAQVFNLRYRLLLTLIGHSLMAQQKAEDAVLIGRLVFRAMFDLSRIADRLTGLPFHAPGGDPTLLAGPPFELPYTLALPEPWWDRWRTVLDLIDATRERIERVLAEFPDDPKNSILAGIRDKDDAARAAVAELARAHATPSPPAPPPPGPAPAPPPPAAVGFARVKQILDGVIAAWKAENGREPKLTQRHQSPGFGWETKQQLLDAVARGHRLIEPGVAGKDTDLVKSLRDEDGVDGMGRMPSGGPFLSEAEIAEIVAWIDAGMPD